ncbi:MAG: DUF1492 domain-containing protein [Lachnospiraceae bacterium]|nr:DUF1492 domain-containing protein [Lachnospiraceae bacterium]
MKVREYLENAVKIDQKIRDKWEQIQNLESMVTNMSASLSDMPGSGNRNVHKFEDMIIKLTEQRDKLTKDMSELIELKISVNNIVNEVSNWEQHEVLVERYLNNLSWGEISVKMNYNIRHIFRLRDQAIIFLEKKYDKLL